MVISTHYKTSLVRFSPKWQKHSKSNYNMVFSTEKFIIVKVKRHKKRMAFFLKPMTKFLC
jgi:hypothetical protein